MSHYPLKHPAQRLPTKACAWACWRTRGFPPNEVFQQISVVTHWGYHYSARYGLYPEVVFCLMMHETGFMSFGGQVTPEMNNPGGLKNTKGDGFAVFASLHRGVFAVVQHIAGYAGIRPPFPDQIVDPRWNQVAPDSGRFGTATTTADLVSYGGSDEYPARVERLTEQLLADTK